MLYQEHGWAGMSQSCGMGEQQCSTGSSLRWQGLLNRRAPLCRGALRRTSSTSGSEVTKMVQRDREFWKVWLILVSTIKNGKKSKRNPPSQDLGAILEIPKGEPFWVFWPTHIDEVKKFHLPAFKVLVLLRSGWKGISTDVLEEVWIKSSLC